MSAMMAEDSPQTLVWGRSTYPHPGLHLGSGNRCGHDPQRLAVERLALPEVNGGHRLQIITKLLKRAEEYFADPASVPLLAYLSGKKNRDGSPRQNRSECRETESLIMSGIIAALDFKSLRVGTYTTRGEFRNVSFDEIAQRVGLTRVKKDPENPANAELVASSRFWRGVTNLKRAGVIEVYEQYEETPEGRRGRPAIKTVSEKFLRRLGGLTKAAMKAARNKASQKVANYLMGAMKSGVQSQEEAKELDDDLRSARMNKVFFPEPSRKNQFPKEVQRDNSADSRPDDYKAYVQQVFAQIAVALGRPLRGAEGMRLFAQHGGLSSDEWGRRRLNR